MDMPLGKIMRNARGEVVPRKFSARQYDVACDENGGYCVACGELHYNVRRSKESVACSACGLKLVYSADDLLDLGRIVGAYA